MLRVTWITGQDVRGDVVVSFYDLSRFGGAGGLPYVPNLAGVGLVSVHASVECQASIGVAVIGGLAPPSHRHLLAPRDAVPWA